MALVTVPLAPGFAAPSTPGAARGHHATIELTTQQGQWDLAGPVTFSYDYPALKGASKKARKASKKSVDGILDRARTDLAALRTQGHCTETGTFAAVAHVGTYQHRYASVVLDIATFACADIGTAGQVEYPAGFAVDVKNGKQVAPTRFVSNQYLLRDEAVKQALFSAYGGTCNTNRQVQAPLPTAVVWGVSKVGWMRTSPSTPWGPPRAARSGSATTRRPPTTAFSATAVS